MKLNELKGTYDAIFTLGDLCLAAIQLEKNQLRPYAGVLDWMASYHLSDVNRLLTNRFARFMNYENLKIVGAASEKLLLVAETEYNVVSNHDFMTQYNTPSQLHAYPEIKAKYDRRIARFLERMEKSKHILFIRTEGTLEEARELEEVLSRLVRHDFKVLLIQHKLEVNGIVESDWPLKRVISVQLPDVDRWNANDALWTQMLSGVMFKES